MDVQFPWEAHPRYCTVLYCIVLYCTVHPRRSHQYMLDMPALIATRFSVTNEDYWHFLQVTEQEL